MQFVGTPNIFMILFYVFGGMDAVMAVWAPLSSGGIKWGPAIKKYCGNTLRLRLLKTIANRV